MTFSTELHRDLKDKKSKRRTSDITKTGTCLPANRLERKVEDNLAAERLTDRITQEVRGSCRHDGRRRTLYTLEVSL